MYVKYEHNEFRNRINTLCGQLKSVVRMHYAKRSVYDISLVLLAVLGGLKKIIYGIYKPLLSKEVKEYAIRLLKLPNLPPDTAETLACIAKEADHKKMKELIKIHYWLQKTEKQCGSALH